MAARQGCRSGFRELAPPARSWSDGDLRVLGVPAAGTAATASDPRLDGQAGPQARAMGHVLQGGGSTRVYASGDTDLFDDMAGFQRPGVDVALPRV